MAAKAKTGKVTRANGVQTREKILDAAEFLFGTQGFAGVSLREITTRADVTLALASYHFGTKENLFEEVVARRAGALCAEREARLAALEAPGLRDILDAFLAPLFEMAASGDPGWPSYFKVLARLGETEEWLPLLNTYFDPTAQRFIEALMEARPGAARDRFALGFTMMLHVMLAMASQNSRVKALSAGVVDPKDFDRLYGDVLDFVVAGVETLIR